MGNDNIQKQVEVIGIQEVIKMREDVKTIETILNDLKEKDKILAESIGSLCNNLEKKIQELSELKKKERENKSKSSNDQIDRLISEVSQLTGQFAECLNQVTEKRLYDYRIALVSIYKPLMHWNDQKDLEKLLAEYDKKNGFKKLCDENLFLKLECTAPQLFNRCKECLENPTYETVLSVSNTIVYGKLNDFLNSEKNSLLNNFVKQVYSENKEIQDKIIAEVQDRPKESMKSLRDKDIKLYKDFLSIEFPEHFYRAPFVKERIHKSEVNKQVKTELIADIDRRLSKFERSEIVIARSLKKLETEDNNLYQKLKLNSEDPLEWKEEIKEVRKLIKENQLDQAIKEAIMKDIALTKELRNIVLKSLEDPDISPSPNEPINREKRKGEERLVACFLYSHYKVLEKQQQKDFTKKQMFNDKLQEINSTFLDTLEKIKNDQQIPLEIKQKLIEQLNKCKILIETWQTTAQNKFGQSKDKSFTEKQSKENQVGLTAADKLARYKQKLHDIQKNREEILNYQDCPPKSELAKEIVQLLISDEFPGYFKKIHENDLNFLALRDQVKNDRKLPVDEKHALVQILSKSIIADREEGYQKEIHLYSSNAEKLREIQEEISNDSELPEEKKLNLSHQVTEIQYRNYKQLISRTTFNFKKLAYEIKKDNLLSEALKKKLNEALEKRETLVKRSLRKDSTTDRNSKPQLVSFSELGKRKDLNDLKDSNKEQRKPIKKVRSISIEI